MKIPHHAHNLTLSGIEHGVVESFAHRFFIAPPQGAHRGFVQQHGMVVAAEVAREIAPGDHFDPQGLHVIVIGVHGAKTEVVVSTGEVEGHGVVKSSRLPGHY